ncbi:aminopeptidase O-like isoform X2 [Ptychodera flava]|uniref:aminopeptidase O-like isoform X2 n=1 Tax=Ptychodera flava TaxID=63121 RepID=UPI00396A9B53
MSTWQAIIHAPPEYVVLMSGDEEAVTKQQDDGTCSHYYAVDVPIPCSMLAIAIGQWRCYRTNPGWNPVKSETKQMMELPFECQHNPKWPCRVQRYDQPTLPSCIYAPPSLIEKAVDEFGECLPMYLEAVFELLGPHPFCRLDVLVVPRCFSSLGMASPSIIFLSQSLLSGDHSMCIRLAHEISHSWFGLIIGARDWTEEWMSEGFATYMEDLIHAKAKKWTPAEQKAHSDLRSLLRYRALKAELENTEEELQTLRPRGDDTRGSESLDGEVTFVKNGLNHEKGFMQVHYIKGYFLLRYLANLVGQRNFDEVIKQYVLKFHCQQVLSQELFTLYFDAFPHLRDQGITMETIYKDWLDHPGMPKDLNPEEFKQSNWLVDEVNSEFEKWLEINSFNQKLKRSPRKKMKLSKDIEHKKLIPDQLVLLLEKLLELDMIPVATLNELDRVYNVNDSNADVRHRWCELLVKHQHRLRYRDVRQFLIEDQAMGVYLYGELMVAEKPREKKLAEECFLAVAKEMDFGCHRIVQEMIYGEADEQRSKVEHGDPETTGNGTKIV